jgi:hypothetical protein
MFNPILNKEANLLNQLNEALEEITISTKQFFRQEAPSLEKTAASSKINLSSLFPSVTSTKSSQKLPTTSPARFGR